LNSRPDGHIGIIHDPGHPDPWIIAMYRFALPKGPERPGYLRTLDYGQRWGIEPMFSDFKSRGFGIADTQIRIADRLERLSHGPRPLLGGLHRTVGCAPPCHSQRKKA
jgi:hypothetical protein